MSLTYTKTDSGLLVAENRASREAVAAALRDHDRDLRLVPSVVNNGTQVLWKVYAYRGSETPAVFLFAWEDQNREPLPLSMNLVEKAKQQDKNSRAPRDNEDTHNARLVAERDRDRTNLAVAVAQEHEPRINGSRTILPRSTSLRMARDKRRARGEKC